MLIQWYIIHNKQYSFAETRNKNANPELISSCLIDVLEQLYKVRNKRHDTEK